MMLCNKQKRGELKLFTESDSVLGRNKANETAVRRGRERDEKRSQFKNKY